MYGIDERDRLTALAGIPQCSTGAPQPVVLGAEGRVAIGYDGEASRNHHSVVVTFRGARTFSLGSPNDEALSGHPLSPKGLTSYAAFEVLDSSWIRELERRNRVHPRHNPSSYLPLRHIILTFHDSTFEVVAKSFVVEDVDTAERSLIDNLATSLLRPDAV